MIEKYFNKLNFQDLTNCFICDKTLNKLNSFQFKCHCCNVYYIFNFNNLLSAMVFNKINVAITTSTYKINIFNALLLQFEQPQEIIQFPISQADKIFNLYKNNLLVDYVSKRKDKWKILM